MFTEPSPCVRWVSRACDISATLVILQCCRIFACTETHFQTHVYVVWGIIFLVLINTWLVYRIEPMLVFTCSSCAMQLYPLAFLMWESGGFFLVLIFMSTFWIVFSRCTNTPETKFKTLADDIEISGLSQNVIVPPSKGAHIFDSSQLTLDQLGKLLRAISFWRECENENFLEHRWTEMVVQKSSIDWNMMIAPSNHPDLNMPLFLWPIYAGEQNFMPKFSLFLTERIKFFKFDLSRVNVQIANDILVNGHPYYRYDYLTNMINQSFGLVNLRFTIKSVLQDAINNLNDKAAKFLSFLLKFERRFDKTGSAGAYLWSHRWNGGAPTCQEVKAHILDELMTMQPTHLNQYRKWNDMRVLLQDHKRQIDQHRQRFTSEFFKHSASFFPTDVQSFCLSFYF